MHRPTVVVLLFVLVVTGYALAGVAMVGLASGATPGDYASPIASENGATTANVTANATVSGQITDEDGHPVADAYVLLEGTPIERLDEALGGDRSIPETLLRFGMADVDGVTVAETDAEGRFSATVPAGEYAVIVVSESRAVSSLRTIEVAGDRTVDLTVDADRVADAELDAPGRIAPGETATITVALENPDDAPVESLSLDLTLPDDWTVESVETDGEWDADARRLHWESVPAGERVEAKLTVRVPDDAERGSYDLELAGESGSHFVESAGYTAVDVLPPGATPTETFTPAGSEHGTPSPDGGDGGTATAISPASTSPATDTPASAPGFGLVAAVVALALLAVRRR